MIHTKGQFTEQYLDHLYTEVLDFFLMHYIKEGSVQVYVIPSAPFKYKKV